MEQISGAQAPQASVLCDMAPIGLCATSSSRVILRCNEEFARMFGYRMDELESRSLVMLYPSEREYQLTGMHGGPVLRETGRYSDERLMKHRSGHLLWCHVVGRYHTPQDQVPFSTWMFEDLSERKGRSVTLTAREREIVALLAKGWTSKEIAKFLGISYRTVEAHRGRIGRKLDASTTVEIVAKLAGLY
ncbi:LuxR C-terminal-related transcriptional regulator [Acidovorax sp. MR-S7]|uniref:LuxR C-terminal-related transcriptional regulator n=1 Tax=unclassified Acidovorax TaxID=2684926 RepID=UPI000372CE4A|nr:LuxR C-terminal-related transcriptional regulator [Acidovorax sp. MR-S7]GAD22160.1 DNA-binding HTH domain-containing proteins [Acidovorax sp. MR-S7]